ncbi:MAG: alanine racemase [Clostridiales bacterium]|nr:alanine racemase [Clostridiales bacterium]
MLGKTGGGRLMAVVKANAYGHGALPVAARALEAGADWLGVALPQEAMELRDAGVTAPIMILGYAEPESYRRLIEAGVRMTVFSLSQGEAIAAAARAAGAQAKVHLKVDTGMGRIGFLPGERAEAEIMAMADLDGLELEGCFTHFARADEDGEDSWRGQLDMFKGLLARLRGRGLPLPIAHCANTAAGMRSGEAMMDMWRVGIGVYGLYPSAQARAWGDVGLKPALSWKSVLSHVKRLPAGWGVGYGHTWVAEKETLIGTVPLGYADGYSRSLRNKAHALVGGKRIPVIGSVCMDQIMLDLTGAPEAKPGDEVVLLGRQGSAEVSADELADLLGTSCYEIACLTGNRLPKKYI